jgi:predicted house-cleaning noncanonical NTP pyrophosphatase (MazG superfamily)
MQKLVRDKIPDIVASKWETEKFWLIKNDTDFMDFLFLKLFEESKEAEESWGDPSEIADVLEVLMTLAARKWISWIDIETTRLEKLASRGWFNKGYLLEI